MHMLLFVLSAALTWASTELSVDFTWEKTERIGFETRRKWLKVNVIFPISFALFCLGIYGCIMAVVA